MKKTREKTEVSLRLKKLSALGIALHRLNKASERELGLSLVQFQLLDALLDSPGSSAQSLARLIGVHPSTLTQGMKLLAKKQFLIVDSHPNDLRKKVVFTTETGKKAHDQFLKKIPSLLENWQET
jgi:DNA-binding MarR family transcriptional regulator